MNTTLFSASIFNFGPLWILAPMLLYLLLLVFSLFPFAQYKFSFAKSKGTLKMFLIIQCIALIGHFYAFATELLPYYAKHFEVVEGNIEDFVAPTNQYNKYESFSIDGVCFGYSPHDISFGYHATILDDGVINETTQNIRIFYVYNPLIDENVIVRIEQLIEAE